MKNSPSTGTPLRDAAERWESEGGSTIAAPTTVPPLQLVPRKEGPLSDRWEARLDDKRARLRAIVEAVDREITCLSRPEADGLMASWDTLVKFLALGPAPETRECPACGRTAMLEATRCGYCWAALQWPLPMPADATGPENL
jgi:hypothetical protein